MGRYRTLVECLASWDALDTGIVTINTKEQKERIGYKALGIKARKIAGLLKDSKLPKGGRVLVSCKNVYDHLASIWGVIYAGGSAVVMAYPEIGEYMPGRRETQRLKDVLDISKAEYILTGTDEAQNLSDILENTERYSIKILSVSDEILKKREDFEADVKPSEDDPAIVLFTSGSTGRPKGVQLTHKKILAGCYRNIDFFNLDSTAVCLNWLPQEHIASLMLLHMVSCVLGSEQLQVSTSLVLSDMTRLLRYISEYGVTMTFAPNFAFKKIYEKSAAIKNMNISLASLRILVDGGEAIDYEMTTHCRNLLVSMGMTSDALIPGWGMTELGNGAIYSRRFPEVYQGSSTSIGKAVAGIEIRIVKDAQVVTQDGIEGSLQIRGDDVFDGYIGESPEEQSLLFDDGWFKTGDLAMLKDGELIITGRESEIYILNGENYSITAIEETVYRAIGDSEHRTTLKVILSRDSRTNADELTLCISRNVSEDISGYKSMDAPEDTSAIETGIVTELSKTFGFTVNRILWLNESEFPKTTIGKIDIKQLKQNLRDGMYETVYADEQVDRWNGRKLTDEQNLLLFIWSDVLDLDKNEISIEDDFFSLGGNSAKVPSVIDKLRLTLGVDVKAADIVRYPTIEGLLEHIHESETETEPEVDDEVVIL